MKLNAGYAAPDRYPTRSIGIGGTDLGMLFEGGKQFPHEGRTSMWVGGLLGDTFDGVPGTAHWRSPVMARSGNMDHADRGIVWDNAAQGGRQIIDYPRMGENAPVSHPQYGAFTIIPNHAYQLPDHSYVGSGFRVKRWGQDAQQEMCWTLGNVLYASTEPHADQWDIVGQWPNLGADQYFQNLTFTMDGPYLVAFGTPEGRCKDPRRAGIYVRRVHWEEWRDPAAWRWWDGSGWSRETPARIIAPAEGAAIGEINCQRLWGRWWLTYVDGARGVVARHADSVAGPWSEPITLIPEAVVLEQMLYAPCLHPWNTDPGRATLQISAWKHAGDKHETYGTFTTQVDLSNAIKEEK